VSRPPLYVLTTEEATLVQRLALVPTVAPVPAAAPEHEHAVCSEHWSPMYAPGTHTITARVCKQKCRCGMHRLVVWPPYTPHCKPTGESAWRS
jgi:hypothetical protein